MMGKFVLNEKQRVRVENNLRLIGFALKRIDVKCIGGWDDAYQIGSIGLMKAAVHYDERRNVTFATFAMTCIMNELRMEWRRKNKLANRALVLSLDDPIVTSGNGTLTLEDMIADESGGPDERLIYRDTCRTILETVRNHRDKDAAILFRMMLERKEQSEVALELGCSQSYVSRKQKKLREAIRQALLEGTV